MQFDIWLELNKDVWQNKKSHEPPCYCIAVIAHNTFSASMCNDTNNVVQSWMCGTETVFVEKYREFFHNNQLNMPMIKYCCSSNPFTYNLWCPVKAPRALSFGINME